MGKKSKIIGSRDLTLFEGAGAALASLQRSSSGHALLHAAEMPL